ncbi:hypothetical protein LCGC14_1532020 [marine sediment metagenome]|uniref:Uncharacterized protein n=1 Tax=marine sediment metagenome TaxID=412755 RepID=A0A0F9JGG5_9ZZZZ
MRLLSLWILIIMLLAFFGVGKALYQDDNTQDIYNVTNRINWNSSILETKQVNGSMTNKEISITRMINTIYIGIDAMARITFEVAKWGVEVGFKNPDWNYLWLAKILTIVIIILFLIPTLVALPYIVAIFYLLYNSIKNFIEKRKKKKVVR